MDAEKKTQIDWNHKFEWIKRTWIMQHIKCSYCGIITTCCDTTILFAHSLKCGYRSSGRDIHQQVIIKKHIWTPSWILEVSSFVVFGTIIFYRLIIWQLCLSGAHGMRKEKCCVRDHMLRKLREEENHVVCLMMQNVYNLIRVWKKTKRTSVRHDDDDVVTASSFTPFATIGINKFKTSCSTGFEKRRKRTF